MKLNDFLRVCRFNRVMVRNARTLFCQFVDISKPCNDDLVVMKFDLHFGAVPYLLVDVLPKELA